MTVGGCQLIVDRCGLIFERRRRIAAVNCRLIFCGGLFDRLKACKSYADGFRRQANRIVTRLIINIDGEIIRLRLNGRFDGQSKNSLFVEKFRIDLKVRVESRFRNGRSNVAVEFEAWIFRH